MNCKFMVIMFLVIIACLPLSAADFEQKSVPSIVSVHTPASEGVLLEVAAKSLEAGIFWDPMTQICLIHKDGHFFQLQVGDSLAVFDFKTVQIIDPPITTPDGSVRLTETTISAIRTYLENRPVTPMYSVGAVLIDPGHGGRDSGAVGIHTINGKKIKCIEKDVVLDVSKQLYHLLKSAYPSKKIVLTRTGDTYPSLEDRVEIANNLQLAPNEAVLYVSVHANASFKKDASGFEVWYLSQDYRRTLISENETETRELANILNTMMEEEFTTESILIAKFILDEMDRQIGSQSVNRGIKEESWFVVRNVHMPSVLIELGFVSNPTEAALLCDRSYLQKISQGIYNGLVTFINYFENSKGFTVAE